jgi:hypothetical protein
MRISCTIDEIDLAGDYDDVPSVSATCSRCGHCTESCGRSEASVRRCLVMPRKQCPERESNFYVEGDEDE